MSTDAYYVNIMSIMVILNHNMLIFLKKKVFE